MIRLLILVGLLATPTAVKAAEPSRAQRPCKEHPEVKPPCFTVRGRLSYWNGTPTARIWIVGTNRVLGVSDGQALPDFEQMPGSVRAQLSWGVNLFGDYEFCPFTPSKPGVMQLGCIQSALHLRAEKRR